jgi:hypothetical protein
MPREYWLDLGAGMDAEHWASTPAPPGVLRVAMDPLLTSGMIASGRLAPLPPDIQRVGGELRPPGTPEMGCAGRMHSFLPFRNGLFTHVHCGFLLHLYLEVLDLLALETYRVLAPGGTLRVLMPHLGDAASEATLARTAAVLSARFGGVETRRFAGPFNTFWSDLYQDRTYELLCVRSPEE